MAQRRPGSSHHKSRVTPKAQPAGPPPRSRRDRRLFWMRVTAGVLILAMLISVLAGVIAAA